VKKEFKSVHRERATDKPIGYDFLNLKTAEHVQHFHESFPQYKKTPLVLLSELAHEIGVAKIYVKDESYRFGLNAFKVLGGSYAMGQVIGGRLGLPSKEIHYSNLVNPKTKDALGELTFVTATDGNHGRGIAWTAAALGQKSVVYMPKGTSLERLNNIQKIGSEAEITEMNYDDAVRFAERQAEQKGWILVQDTAWAGYEEIPTWIMQGYMTMAFEAYQQLIESGEDIPTHIVLQAGVGSMAGAVQGFFATACGKERPITVIVEPNKADCIFRTAQANDGTLHCVTGDMDTIMAGLACGEPSTIGWRVLDETADAFVSCPDTVAAKGMRVLGNPIGADERVISGESGAVGVGLVVEVMTKPDLSILKEQLKLDKNSRILFFSTEGDTDRVGYRSVVWDGSFSSV